MLKKAFLLVALAGMFIMPLISVQAQAPLPEGIFDALSDLGLKLGKSFRIDCTNPDDSSTCKSNDPKLIWSWSAEIYPDASLGCPQAGQSYAQVQTRGFKYIFTYDGTQIFDYRQSVDRTVLFLCTSSGPVPSGSTIAPATGIDTTQCPLPTRLNVGMTARVIPANGIPNRMRASAGTGGAYLSDIPAGGQFTITGGPTCANQLVWWQVNYNNTTGWTAEGQIDAGGSPDYWLEPLAGTATGSDLTAGLLPITTTNANRINQIAAQSLPFNIRDVDYWKSFEVIALASGTEIRLQPHDNWLPNAAIAVGNNGQEIAHVAVVENTSGARLMATSQYNATTDITQIKLWDAGAIDTGITAQERATLPFPARLVGDMEFNPDGTRLAVSGSDGTQNIVQIYDVATGNVIATLNHTAFPAAIAYNPQVSTLAVATVDSQIHIWDTNNHTEIKTLAGYNPHSIRGGTHTVAINSMGTRLAYTGNENILQLWDLTNYSVLREIPMPVTEGAMIAADTAFSPDGSLMVVAGGVEMLNQGETQIYDVATGNLLARIPVYGIKVQFAGDNALHIFSNAPSPSNNWFLYGVR